MGSGFCPEFCHVSTMSSKCKYCYFYYFVFLLLWWERKGLVLKYGTSHRLRGILSSVTDQNREEGRNALSFELIVNHTALAIICLHIIALWCAGERFPFTVWSKHTLSPISIKRRLALLVERVIVSVITVFSLCSLSPNSSNYFVEKFASELLMPVKAASLTSLTPEPEALYPQKSLKSTLRSFSQSL